MHELIAAPFLGEYFLLRPGAVSGVKLPRAKYEELASAPADTPCPWWTAEAARRAFGLNLAGLAWRLGMMLHVSTNGSRLHNPCILGLLAMHRLAVIGCPDLPVKQARQRWVAYVDREAGLELLDGDALLHTDFKPA